MNNTVNFHEPIFRKERNGTYSVNKKLVELFQKHGYEIVTKDIYQMLIDSHIKLTVDNGENGR